MKEVQAINRFKRFLQVEKGLSENSIYSNTYDLKKFSDFMSSNNKDILTATQDDIQQFLEIVPPRGHDPTGAVAAARELARNGVDCVNIPDGPRASARMSPMALATPAATATPQPTATSPTSTPLPPSPPADSARRPLTLHSRSTPGSGRASDSGARDGVAQPASASVARTASARPLTARPAPVAP